MSWNVSAVGKAGAVRANVARQFKKLEEGTMLSPEKEAAVAVGQAVDLALSGCSGAVKVQCYGSGSFDSGKWVGQTISVSLEPIYGFVE